jgi:hypothetical protein
LVTGDSILRHGCVINGYHYSEDYDETSTAGPYFNDPTTYPAAVLGTNSACSSTTIAEAAGLWTTSSWLDTSIAIAACPFIIDKCSADQSLTYELNHETDPAFAVIPLIAVTGGFSCTYMLSSPDGAPGFMIESEFDVGDVVVSWTEYDVSSMQLDPFNYGKWPPPSSTSTTVFCGDSCA